MLSGSTNINLSINAVIYYTSNPTGDWTFNFRGDASTPLDNILAIGDSMTTAALVTIGATPYYMTTLQIDGTTVQPKWVSEPTAGTANSIEVYTFTIIKTAAAQFTVLATVTPYV